MTNPPSDISQIAEQYYMALEAFIAQNITWWQASKQWLNNTYGATIEDSITKAKSAAGNNFSSQGTISIEEHAVVFQNALSGVVNVTNNAEQNYKNIRKMDIPWQNNDAIRTLAQSALSQIQGGDTPNQPVQSNATNIPTTWDEKKFSISVNKVLKTEILQNGASLADLLQEFRNIHPEYGSLSTSNTSKSSGQTAPLAIFIGKLRDHFSSDGLHSAEWAKLVDDIYNTNNQSLIINGRMFIIGALLAQFSTPGLISQNKFLLPDALSMISILGEEHKADYDGGPFTPWLRPGWENIYQGLLNYKDDGDTGEQPEEDIMDAKNLSDYPSKDDSLSRKSLAQYLAKRLHLVYERDVTEASLGSFFMMVDGAWGSGKSTLIGFIKDVLEEGIAVKNPLDGSIKQEKWIVANFNAWENQRLDPPWWFLMKGVYSEIIVNLKKDKPKNRWRICRFIFNEYKWRLNTGTNNLPAVAITLILFLAALYWGVNNQKGFEHLWIPETATFIGFLWSLTKFFRTSLVPGSAKAAQTFIQEFGKDPMQVLAAHFKKQIEIAGKPVAIFIDDLDRCNKDYGIKLLEGLQTIFRKAPVIYLIAADKRWLSTMFEKQYDIFSPAIAKPSKSFGLIFLDKIFQWIVELPDISVFQKRTYWNYLLDIKDPDKPKVTKEEIKAIKQDVANAPTNTAKIKLADTSLSEEKQQVTREVIVSSLSIKEEEKKLKHKLQKFIDLVEPNPRAMKRLINDISTLQAMNFLYKQGVKENQLILWCILKLQHPFVAEFFWNSPNDVEEILSSQNDELATKNPGLYQILQKTDVRKLFSFQLNDETVKLDMDFIDKMKFNK